MKDSLQQVIELQQRYIEISEYKKIGCVDIEKAFPNEKHQMSDKKSQLSMNGESDEEDQQDL